MKSVAPIERMSRVAGCSLAALVLFGLLTDSRADEPAGTITVSREVPPRDAFRAGQPGTAHKVATAREDVVIANARTLEASVANMPGIRQQEGMVVTQGVAANVSTAIAGAALGAGIGRVSATGNGNVTEGFAAGQIALPVNSLAGTLNSAMRGR